jgi:hypothetical protein
MTQEEIAAEEEFTLTLYRQVKDMFAQYGLSELRYMTVMYNMMLQLFLDNDLSQGQVRGLLEKAIQDYQYMVIAKRNEVMDEM